MKRLLFLSFAGLLSLGLATGCCKDQSLSASKAKSLVKKEMARMHIDNVVTSISTGYYECNDDDARYTLRQLAANDVITYKCDRIQKMERVRKSRRVQRGYFLTYYDTEYYYVNEPVTTYFVTVALTEKGQKLVVEKQEVEPTADRKELRLDDEIDLSKFPEASVKYQEFSDAEIGVNDAVSTTATPVLAESASGGDADEAIVEATTVTPVLTESVSGGDADKAIADSEVASRSPYDIAKSKEDIVIVNVKAYTQNVVKVRNIRQNNSGYLTAEAEVLMEASNVTPFGRILGSVYDGKRKLLEDVHFVYYQDKGWELKDTDE